MAGFFVAISPKGFQPSAKPTDKQQKLFDGGGLFLLVEPLGGRRWVLKYRFAGKERVLRLVSAPGVSLSDARKRRDEARNKLAAGTDPGEAKKTDKRAARLAAANSFEAVALAWMKERGESVEIGQYEKTLARFKNDAFPRLGKRPVSEIGAPEILAVIKRVDSRGARFTAHRLRSEISRVFRYAIKEGHCKSDPARDLIGAIPPTQTTHFAPSRSRSRSARCCERSAASPVPSRCCARSSIALMLFVRPGELRKAEWEQFDLGKGEWRYLVTKTTTAHLVPLAAQAVTILQELQALTEAGQ